MDGVKVSAEQEHKLYLPTKKSFQDLDIPPRKLLTHQNDSPRILPEETLLHKFLPNSDLDDEFDPYASDEFRMYEFKIRKCTRSRSHDWTDCPFAHPGEKARRRCPRRFNYSGNVCADFRRGSCVRGDVCEFAHGVFECWLHPSRYRTEACKDGKNCHRKICFFAHTPSQLRLMTQPEPLVLPVNSGHCAYCRCHPGMHHTSSPTSILDMHKLTPPTSPALSPAKLVGGVFSPVSPFSDKLVRSGGGYEDPKNELVNQHAIEEVMQSMNCMNMNAIDEDPRLNFLDGNDDQQSFFAFSPSGSGRTFPAECNFVNEISTSGPDLDWVNDLLT